VKIIPLSAIKAKLSHYARLCRDQPIIVTVNGRPSFQLVPLDEEDDLIACALEHHPRFGNLLERRLDERLSHLDVAERRSAPSTVSKVRVSKRIR